MLHVAIHEFSCGVVNTGDRGSTTVFVDNMCSYFGVMSCCSYYFCFFNDMKLWNSYALLHSHPPVNEKMMQWT